MLLGLEYGEAEFKTFSARRCNSTLHKNRVTIQQDPIITTISSITNFGKCCYV